MSSMPKLRLASFVSDASDTTTSDSGGTGGRDDTDAVRTLVSAFATQQRATPDMNSLERYLRETSSEKCFTILAETITSKHDASEEVQTDVIAYAMCCLGISSFAGAHLLNLHDIYVAESYRSQGVGQQLMDAVKREARARGCIKLTLEAHELNTGAIRFYEKNGLECWDTWDTKEKARTFFYAMKLKPVTDAESEPDDGFTVRLGRFPATPADGNGVDDTDAVCALVSAFATRQQTTADLDALARFLRDEASGAFTLVVEKKAGEDEYGGSQPHLVAYAMCCLGVSSFAGGSTLNLHDIYVADTYRSQGIGQQLLDAVKREARARGCIKLTLEAHELNKGAIRFYEKNGLECWDTWDTDEKGKTLFYAMKLKAAADIDVNTKQETEAIKLPNPSAADPAFDSAAKAGDTPAVQQPTSPSPMPGSEDVNTGTAPGAGADAVEGDDDDDFGDFGDFNNMPTPPPPPPAAASTDDDFGDFGDMSPPPPPAIADDDDDDFGDFGDALASPPQQEPRNENIHIHTAPSSATISSNGIATLTIQTDAASIRSQLSQSLATVVTHNTQVDRARPLYGVGNGDEMPSPGVREYVERITAKAESSPRREQEIDTAAMKSLALPPDVGSNGRHVVNASHAADMIQMEIMLIEALENA